MTSAYEWNPMPHKVDVHCPCCKEHALFEFAEIVKISLKRDVEFFQDSDLFEYQLFKDSCGHNCHFRGKHVLNWPSDAYFSIAYKSDVLWAFNRESALELKKYIQSNDRDTSKYKWSNFLLHIPSLFKQSGARDEVVKRLNGVLNGKSL